MRSSELFNLKKDCLYYKEKDGYFLRHAQSKRGTEDILNYANRPIPAVAAHAIQLMISMGNEIKKISNEKSEYAIQSLFYLACTSNSSSFNSKVKNDTYLTIATDRFCDYVALTPDEKNRRWYIRTHESRKSFLITFFWCFKYSSLGAASWMAGHISWEMTLRYIESNFPGDELPEFEASYAAEQLWSFEKNEPTEPFNVHELYKSVCQHFGVMEISLIEDGNLQDWLAYAFRSKIYSIEPVQLNNKKTKEIIDIAFRIRRENIDDQH